MIFKLEVRISWGGLEFHITSSLESWKGIPLSFEYVEEEDIRNQMVVLRIQGGAPNFV